MASQKMKFKMNIKELSFEFEGDFDQGQKIQSGISKTLSELGNLQTGAMGLPTTKPVEARVIEALPPTRTRRRRRKSEAAVSDSNGAGEEAAEETGNGEKISARKPTGSSPIRLLKDLKQNGFFEGGKSVSEIVTHVNAKGHTKMINSSFSAQLLSLSKKEILERKQDETGGWKYYPGTRDE